MSEKNWTRLDRALGIAWCVACSCAVVMIMVGIGVLITCK